MSEELDAQLLMDFQREAYIRGAKDALLEIRRRVIDFRHIASASGRPMLNPLPARHIDWLLKRADRGHWPPKEDSCQKT